MHQARKRQLEGLKRWPPMTDMHQSTFVEWRRILRAAGPVWSPVRCSPLTLDAMVRRGVAEARSSRPQSIRLTEYGLWVRDRLIYLDFFKGPDGGKASKAT